ncbi:unknown [Clostridium sp. CAG:1193]|nr:unknown [Clostridium sp. CAG:1193]
MFGKILGIVLLILLGLFTICSCKVASWADQEMEENLRKRNQDEEKDI